MEVYVKADLNTCRQRDPKKLYEKLEDTGIANFTGVDSNYEVPESPDLILDTMAHDKTYCTDALLDAILQKLS